MTTFEKNAVIIGQICNRIEPGKKMMQKLMYLIDRRGVDLDLHYSIHFYGPYSVKLEDEILFLNSLDKLEINTSGRTHLIHLGSSPIEGELEKDEQERVDFVLDHFASRSASELEAITTLDYVAFSMLKGHSGDDEVVRRVKQIKGSKFDEKYLWQELQILKQFGYASMH